MLMSSSGPGAPLGSLLLPIARWISAEDPVDWLVSNPAGKSEPVATFRDARKTLALLDLSPLKLSPGLEQVGAVTVRVGPVDWLNRHSRDVTSAIDFSHAECLDLIERGGTPSFFEDVSDGVVFVLSVIGLPHWSVMPSLPVRRLSLLSLLRKATFASDLARFALRLWFWGIPTVFLCPAGHCYFPDSFSGLRGLQCSRLGSVEVWRTAHFDWEPLCFTFS